MSKYTRFVFGLIIVQLVLAFVIVSCAPPPTSDETTQKIQDGYSLTIGTPNAQYRTEVLEVSDRVQVLKFYDPANKVTCYLGIQSISCVK